MKAVLLTAQGVQDEEFIYPYYRLQEEGFDLAVVSPEGGDLTGKYGISMKQTIKSSNFPTNTLPDLIVVPGGWQAPELMRLNREILHLVRAMNNNDKVIAAICHGPQVLISSDIVRGRKITAYKGIRDDIVNAGAEYINTNVVVDKNIVTAPHYRNNPEFMKETLDVVRKRYS